MEIDEKTLEALEALRAVTPQLTRRDVYVLFVLAGAAGRMQPMQFTGSSKDIDAFATATVKLADATMAKVDATKP